jgi:hypothetical protein
MSIQTWATEKDWWTALETVKSNGENLGPNNSRENILISREFSKAVSLEYIISASS